MKILKYVAMVIAGFYFFSACKKELSAENGYALGNASGSLKNISGQCQAANIKGSYVTNVAVKDSNYVVVQVNFTKAGRYKISTDTSNGFSFLDSGFTLATGLQNITLKASGTPLAAMQTNFFLSFDTSFCSFTVPVTDTTINSGIPAVYMLSGSPGSCANAQILGTYTAASPLTSANQVSIQLLVTTVGSYSITAGPVNGMAFAANGTFSVTGLQTVILQGSGTPAAAETDTIPLTAGGTSCQFVVPVISLSGQTAADSAWSFTNQGTFYNGPFDSAYLMTTVAGTVLTFEGHNVAADRELLLSVLLPSATIQPGTYSTARNAAFFYDDLQSSNIFHADPTTAGVNLSVVITAYDPIRKIVTGTFSGTVNNANTVATPITTGLFKAVIE